jgi:hypothetical protein
MVILLVPGWQGIAAPEVLLHTLRVCLKRPFPCEKVSEQTQKRKLDLDMDSDTFSVWMDETEWVSDQPLITTGTSFGRVKLAITSGCVPENRFSVDQLRVLDWMPSVPIAETTWGRVRAFYR